MPETVVINFVADTDQLQKAVPAIESITKADQQLEAQVRKGSDAMNQQLNSNTNSTKIAKVSIDQLSQSVKDMNKEALGIKSGTDTVAKFAKEINNNTEQAKTLVTQLRAMKQELSAMETAGKAGSKQFIDLAVKAGKLEDQIGDTAARVRILASDTKNLDAALSLATGVAGGFAIAQGAAALFGKENEEIQKALLKVQAALAILNGLQAVAATLNKDSAASVVLLGSATEGTSLKTVLYGGALKVVSAIARVTGLSMAASWAIATVGLSVIITGITLLIANWKTLFGEVDKGIDAIRKVADAMKETTAVFEDDAQRQIQITKSKGETTYRLEKDLNENILRLVHEEQAKRESIRWQGTEDEWKANEDRIKELVKQEKDLNAQLIIQQNERNNNAAAAAQIIRELNISALEGIQKELAALKEKEDQKFRDQNAQLIKLGASDEQFRQLSIQLQAEYENEKKSIVKKYSDQAIEDKKKNNEDIKNLEKKSFEELKSIVEDNIDQQTGQEEKAANAELERIANIAAAENKAAYDNQNLLADTAAFAKKIGEDQFDVLVEFLESEYDTFAEFEKAKQEKLKETADVAVRLQERIRDAEVQLANQVFSFMKAINDNKIKMVQDRVDAGLITEKAGEKEIAALRRKQAEKDKVQGIFNAIINTASAIAQINANPAVNLDVTQTLRSTLTALVSAIGLTQVATIIAQPIPKFAAGTESVKGGIAGRDSVPAILMPGERVVPAHINKQLAGISNIELPAILRRARYPDLPYISDSQLSSMEAMRFRDMGANGIDYTRLAEEIGNQIAKHERLEVNLNERGFEKRIMRRNSEMKILDDQYKWSN